VHFPCADVQLQREERIPLGGGPKRQHSGVQALQKTKRIMQKVKKMLQDMKKIVKKVKEMLQEVSMTLHLSLLIKKDPYWDLLSGIGCTDASSSDMLDETTNISVFDGYQCHLVSYRICVFCRMCAVYCMHAVYQTVWSNVRMLSTVCTLSTICTCLVNMDAEWFSHAVYYMHAVYHTCCVLHA